MSLNLNKVILAGRMVADPELKQTPSGASVVSFRLAVNRSFRSRDAKQQPEADFFNVTAWQSTAEFVAKHFRKGSAICVCGRIQTRTRVDQNGQKHYMTDIIAEEINFVESKGDRGESFSPDTHDGDAPSFSTPAEFNAPNFEEIDSTDDLPF